MMLRFPGVDTARCIYPFQTVSQLSRDKTRTSTLRSDEGFFSPHVQSQCFIFYCETHFKAKQKKTEKVYCCLEMQLCSH